MSKLLLAFGVCLLFVGCIAVVGEPTPEPVLHSTQVEIIDKIEAFGGDVPRELKAPISFTITTPRNAEACDQLASAIYEVNGAYYTQERRNFSIYIDVFRRMCPQGDDLLFVPIIPDRNHLIQPGLYNYVIPQRGFPGTPNALGLEY